MEKHKAIPQECMTVGEMATMMGVTVRTLRYYDREGLLSPSSESENGYRLYTSKEVIKLFQILSMKKIGLSLGEIKTRLLPVETSEDVENALTEQAEEIRGKLTALNDVLVSIEELKCEVEKTDTVDWVKYANIAASLQARLMYLKVRRQSNFNQNGGK